MEEVNEALDELIDEINAIEDKVLSAKLLSCLDAVETAYNNYIDMIE